MFAIRHNSIRTGEDQRTTPLGPRNIQRYSLFQLALSGIALEAPGESVED